MSQPLPPDEIFFSMADLKRLFVEHKKKILRMAFFCAIAAFLLVLSKEPTYQAIATFRQSSGKADQVLNFKSFLKGGLQDSEAGAIAVLQSKRIMRNVIEKLGMQAEVASSGLFVRGFSRIYDSFAAECGFALSDPDLFVFQDVVYEGEKTLSLFLRFQTPDVFEVLNNKKQVLAVGKVKEKVTLENISFCLEKTPVKFSLNKNYSLRIAPWTQILENSLSKFTVKPSKIDKNYLTLSFVHRNRYLARDVLNQMMSSYQQYLKEENEEIAQVQLAYLEKRQDELAQKWDHILEEQVAYMRRNLGDKGFIGLSQEIELLAIPKEEYTSKLLDMDLELKRLEKSKGRAKAHTIAAFNDEEKEEVGEKNRAVISRKKQLAKEKRTNEESPSLLSYVEEGQDFEKRLLSVEEEQQKMLSLIPSQKTTKHLSDLDGINLETAQDLYKEYNHQLDAIQVTREQLSYFCKQLELPDFEISSLSNLLTDSVSQEMIQRASQLALQLRDENNRSIKEQERLKEQLDAQKKFLNHHIGQTIELHTLKVGLLEEKIAALQDISIRLIRNEKKLIEEKLQELHTRMADLPEKWRLENQLKMKKELSMSVMEAMTQLAEAKIVNQHLFQVESKALDFALAPYLARSPHLLLFTLSAAFLGAASRYMLALLRGIARGLPLSLATLKAYGETNCGVLSSLCDCSLNELNAKDLERLRRTASFLGSRKNSSKGLCAALLGGRPYDYSQNLAALLGLRGSKVLLVECSFEGIITKEKTPGLWQHLKEGSPIQIRSREYYDYIPSGTSDSRAVEILELPRFSEMIEEMKERYDFVLLHTTSTLNTVKSHLLLRYADAVIGVLTEERWEDCQPYVNWKEKKGSDSITWLVLEKV